MISPALASKLEELERRREALGAELSRPAVAADGRSVVAKRRELGALEKVVSKWRQCQEVDRLRAEAESLLSGEMAALAREEVESLERRGAELVREIENLILADPEDDRGRVILEIRAGEGGEEAGLFASDLLAMYQRYAEARGWKMELLQAKPTDLGGLREAIVAVEGDGVWRRLRYESGGHRVQRVPATEARGRVHTSAATVAVLPEVEDVEVDLRPEDLEVETMRASGPGGQHVNKTSSAVRITHVPTKTVVHCQDERSQHKNRAKALRILRFKLYERVREERDRARAEARRGLIGSGVRGEKVRTYNFPQNRVTDHRTGKTVHDLPAVLAGRLDPILDDLAEKDRERRLALL